MFETFNYALVLTEYKTLVYIKPHHVIYYEVLEDSSLEYVSLICHSDSEMQAGSDWSQQYS